MTDLAADPPPLRDPPHISSSQAQPHHHLHHHHHHHSPSFSSANNHSLQSFGSSHMSQPPPETEDVDMSMSITLPPLGQNHDRDGPSAPMDTDDPPSAQIVEAVIDSAGQTASPSPSSSAPSRGLEDAMDTSPDNGVIQLVGLDMARNDGTAEQERIDQANTESTSDPQASLPPPPPPPPIENPEPPAEAQSEVPEQTQPQPSSRPPSPSARNGEQGSGTNRDGSSTDDEDDSDPPWHELTEDTSSPDEQELQEIEAVEEFSALNHDHWRTRTFTDLQDPEYTLGDSGMIEWTIKYNGTKEAPNRELVMLSDPVKIGGHDWRIKFYPRGMNNDYLSVFLECVSVNPTKDGPDADTTATSVQLNAHTEQKEDDPAVKSPLAPLSGSALPRRPGVSAQAAIVLYNPMEPRVNVYRSWQHLYCPKQSDWGFERYHGPYYEIHQRMRGQRQALLRDDTLAMTAYIRIVHDDTGCLWEHSSSTNPWNSQEIVGLQSLAMSLHPRSTGDGSLITALSLWLMLPPFRALMYEADTALTKGSWKPMLLALVEIVYMMRTPSRNKSGSPHVSVHQVVEALRWYGIKTTLDDLDVVQVWHVLRTVLQREFADTPNANGLDVIFGPQRDLLGRSTYRIPADSSSVATGLASLSPVTEAQQNPLAITVEIQRQTYNEKERSWAKTSNRVDLDNSIELNGVGYTLYGFAAHRGVLQSDRYHSVIRPGGSDGKWYCFQDSRDGNKVVCITKRRALHLHEGCTTGGSNDEEKLGVPYLVLYLRSDLFGNPEPEWNVRDWLAEVCDKERASISVPEPFGWDRTSDTWADMQIDKPAVGEAEASKATDTDPAAQETPTLQVEVVNSLEFLSHRGPGVKDLREVQNMNDALDSTPSELRKTVTVHPSELNEARKTIAKAFDVEVSQCRVRGMSHGTELQPFFTSLEEYMLNWDGVDDSGLLWLHIVPTESKNPSVEEAPPVDESAEIYFFLKTFDAEKQQLVAQGSHIEAKASRVDKTVAKILGIPTSSDSFPDIFCEKDSTTVTQVNRRKTFIQECVPDAVILITAAPLTDQVKLELHEKGLATTVRDYLEMESWRRNFPDSYQGTFEVDHFSSPYYKGEMLAGRPHGQGSQIALNGAKYTGSFALAARHGEGFLEYTNGDTYRGSFANNLRHGQGQFTEAETDNVYEGGWKKDKRFGEGRATYKKAQGMVRVPECKICYEEDADCFFVDCGHVVACLSCAKRMENCPVCRRKVLRVNQLQFTVGC